MLCVQQLVTIRGPETTSGAEEATGREPAEPEDVVVPEEESTSTGARTGTAIFILMMTHCVLVMNIF